MLRLALDNILFRATELYLAVEKWEDQNRPHRIAVWLVCLHEGKHGRDPRRLTLMACFRCRCWEHQVGIF
jgi:hypothetical protein